MVGHDPIILGHDPIFLGVMETPGIPSLVGLKGNPKDNHKIVGDRPKLRFSLLDPT